MKKILIATAVAAAFGMANAAEQADIVVIGAGGAGMAAAVQAHDNGIKKVVIIEKMRLGERTDWVLVGSVLCGLAGICMVLQPSCGSHELPYAVLAVLSAILAAGSAMFLKRLGAAGEPIFRTVFWFSAASLVISAVAEAFLSRASMKDLFTDPMLFAVGICTMGAQLAQTLGWGRGRPLLCACLQFSAILFAVFFGWLFFDEKLESFATVGIVIIIAAELAAAVIGLRSRARRGSSA